MDELTSKMHLEFFEGEEKIEIAALIVYAEVSKHGKSLDDALKEYKITNEQYEKYRPCQSE